MIAIITKASDRKWYEFKEINTIEDVLELDERTVVHRRDDDVDYCWLPLKPGELEFIKEKVGCDIVIYDDYIE